MEVANLWALLVKGEMSIVQIAENLLRKAAIVESKVFSHLLAFGTNVIS